MSVAPNGRSDWVYPNDIIIQYRASDGRLVSQLQHSFPQGVDEQQQISRSTRFCFVLQQLKSTATSLNGPSSPGVAKHGARWMPDNSQRKCPFCLRAWSFLRRRHHCRVCGTLMCSKCQMGRLPVVGYTGPQRACRTCVQLYRSGSLTAQSSPVVLQQPQTSSAQSPAPSSPTSFSAGVQSSALLPVDGNTFNKIKSQIEDEDFSDDQLNMLKMAKANWSFTCQQVVEIIGLFSMSEDKLAVLRELADRVADPSNKFQISGAFTFSDDKEEAQRILSVDHNSGSMPVSHPVQQQQQQQMPSPVQQTPVQTQTQAHQMQTQTQVPVVQVQVQSTGDPLFDAQQQQMMNAVNAMNNTIAGMSMTVNTTTSTSHSSSSHTGSGSSNTQCMQQPPHTVSMTQSAFMPVDMSTFNKIKSQIEAEDFSDDQLGVLKMAKANWSFACQQIVEIIDLFTMSEDKLAALRELADRVADPSNKFQVPGAFTYSTDKEEAQLILSATVTTTQAPTVQVQQQQPQQPCVQQPCVQQPCVQQQQPPQQPCVQQQQQPQQQHSSMHMNMDPTCPPLSRCPTACRR
ncbi:MAG: hypothetical protein MHM6MM_005975 [Cercozoa sp. M6MM]